MPYINSGEAHGLSFSTKSGLYTPSLTKIHKAIESTVEFSHREPLWDNNLTRWADQGVFLLNTILTVREGVSKSHDRLGWQNFTKATLRALMYKKHVYMLWGKDALNIVSLNKLSNGIIFSSEHPVYASYKQRDWVCNDCFNNVNNALIVQGKSTIRW